MREEGPDAKNCFYLRAAVIGLFLVLGSCRSSRAEAPKVDLSGYRVDSGVTVGHSDGRLRVSWALDGRTTDSEDRGQLVLDLRPGRALIQVMGYSGATASPVLENLDPVAYLLVGSRQAPAGRPPGMSVFNVFFDTPANRPFETYRTHLDLKRVRVTSQGHHTTVAIGDVTAGPFTGEMQFTIYRFSRLLHIETVIHTQQDRRAILYDAGLTFASPSDTVRFNWVDTEGKLHSQSLALDAPDRHLAVRHRALIAETARGSIACFPPPHQFFFPRDLTENLSTVWFGRGHRGKGDDFGFGIRQSERGGGSFVPWFNAPAGTEQRLGVFYLFSSLSDSQAVLREVLRYTHGDRFPRLQGYRTLTSHWHMATAMAALQEKAKGGPRSTPDFVRMFKDMGVEIVHLAEFHGDGHPQDPGPLRLPEMRAMFDECERLSDEEILFLPGEEANAGLGRARPGKDSGHWMYLFPKPVYLTMTRSPAQPFMEDHPPFGRVYHVGDGADMLRLFEREGGLAWTSHARIKGSSWTPDVFRGEDFYLSDHWLGAAWKAMPADLSHDRLGRRALDLLDDMANWGQKKYLPGEVDVFKLDHTHELFGHMNINYLRLEPDQLPRFASGWQPVVDSLRSGRFFVTTGEVLIPKFEVERQPSGSTVVIKSGGQPEVHAELEWTFPLRFVELISGDGSRIFRERIDCSDTDPFAQRTLRLNADLTGRTWVRLEAWDIAGDGAFTQPVWLTPAR
jgi:hypothetical protein